MTPEQAMSIDLLDLMLKDQAWRSEYEADMGGKDVDVSTRKENDGSLSEQRSQV